MMKKNDNPQDAAIEMIAAYEDDELDVRARAHVMANQLASESGLRQAAVQRAVRERLAAEPTLTLSTNQRQRLVHELRAAAANDPAPKPKRSWSTWRPFAWSGWAFAAALALWIALVRPGPTTVGPPAMVAAEQLIPMAEAAFVDFQQRTAEAIPATNLDLTALSEQLGGLSIEPLGAPNARLLSAWETKIRNRPAAALAYQWRARIVIQYVIPEELLYRQDAVKQAIAQNGHYLTVREDRAMVARASERSGILLVGEAEPEELAMLH